jgi:hypothetical protein
MGGVILEESFLIRELSLNFNKIPPDKHPIND